MRGALSIRAAALVLTMFWISCNLASAGQETSAKARAAIVIWDTGQSSAEPLAPKSVTAHEGWSALTGTGKDAPFKGDAVMTNGRTLAVVRQRGAAVEVYSVGNDGPTARLRLHVLTSSGELDPECMKLPFTREYVPHAAPFV